MGVVGASILGWYPAGGPGRRGRRGAATWLLSKEITTSSYQKTDKVVSIASEYPNEQNLLL